MNGLRRIDLAVAGPTLAEEAELAGLAAQAGLRGVWVSEVAGLDMVTQAAAVGRALPQGRVGTAMVPVQTRDPLLMAMTAAGLVELLDGRFVLGLGTSTRVIIEDWHARPWGRPLRLMREYVALLRAFLRGERVTTTGAFPYRRARLDVQPAAPIPVYLAALADGMLALAGEIADGVILNFVGLASLRHALSQVEVGARRSGRTLNDIEVIAYFRTSVVTDYSEIRERYRRELLTYALAPVYQRVFAGEGYGEMCAEAERRWQAGDRQGALAALPDAFVRARVLAGTADEIAGRLNDYFGLGLNTAIILPVPAPSQEAQADSARIITTLGRIAAPEDSQRSQPTSNEASHR